MERYTILTNESVRKLAKSLDRQRRARVDRVYTLFETYGRFLPTKYLKKLSGEVWELRPGDMRLFLAIRGTRGYIVHGILKKSQKTPIKDLELARKRILESNL